FCRTRGHHNLHLFPADSRDTLRQLMNALKQNEVTAFIADRYVSGSSLEVPFFGQPARLPTAPVSLALRTGAPALGIFCWRDPGGWSHGALTTLVLSETPSDEVQSDEVQSDEVQSDERERVNVGAGGAHAPARARSSTAIAHAMAIYVREMERRITAHPEQWVSALAKVWEE
ncbi:MAG: lysophospholipid acyltransferase family protein, partial [Ktedonobacterales bacterium]|nr:lysophospholipid acyltransferase family protein [Ktedonobacterales bacterium]